MPFYTSLMPMDPLADLRIFVWPKMPLLLLSLQLTDVWGPHVSFFFNLLPPLQSSPGRRDPVRRWRRNRGRAPGGGEHSGGREGAREGPEAEVEAQEGGRAREEGAGELQVRPDQGRAVHEDELLGALGGEELEAAHELVPVRGHGGWP